MGYFNLRGWRNLAPVIGPWAGEDGSCCRVLVGMQRTAREDVAALYGAAASADFTDLATANRIRKRAAHDFKEQLVIGVPNEEDERALRSLSHQLRVGKLRVKLFLRHPLHAKLYLCFRHDHNVPIVAYLGSSNLTISGLYGQGELNIDVLDQDACRKLDEWFTDRWDDRLAVDISTELAEIIDDSWARETSLAPALIYYKTVFHLSREARSGLSEFAIPEDLQAVLLDHQISAVKIAAKYLSRRGGVLLGDVVGLGKTLMAIALARVFQDDPQDRSATLVVCPRNLTPMWERYFHLHGVAGKVVPLSRVNELENLPRFQTLIIDESHNLRNRETKRYRAIKQYIARNNCRCILLSATPYNKGLIDLSSQLRLFVQPEQDLGVRPERLLREMGELPFVERYQVPVRSLSAFEKSPYPEDWRELMSLFMIRRTRSYVEQNNAEKDETTGRSYLRFGDGSRFFFPKRLPITLPFEVEAESHDNIYARLQSVETVNLITNLRLPRYGLGNYVRASLPGSISAADAEMIKGLSRAGKRLIGFCKTGFFKRLESEAYSFLASVRRHLVRNSLFIHALKSGLPLPIGIGAYSIQNLVTSDPEEFDDVALDLFADGGKELIPNDSVINWNGATEGILDHVGAVAYRAIADAAKSSQRWISADFFTEKLLTDLCNDNVALLGLLNSLPPWGPDSDAKLIALEDLVKRRHPNDKLLVFTQYADTALYLVQQLRARGVQHIAAVTSETENPTEVACRFSPKSNNSELRDESDELRILVTTDVLSEGQNLQDCSIVVNFDLPWAIIRLIQRAGRVDRIGQVRSEVKCYTFMPSDGVDRVIRLRHRLRERLRENAEVIGTDERFFEEHEARTILSIYAEKPGSLDDDEEGEVDLASHCLAVWQKAIARNPQLESVVPALPNVVYSTMRTAHSLPDATCAITYTRTSEGVDSLSLVKKGGTVVSEAPFEILKVMECDEATPPAPRSVDFFSLVRAGVEHAMKLEVSATGVLGRASTRSRLHDALRQEVGVRRNTLFESGELDSLINKVFSQPLQEAAEASLRRMFRAGAPRVEIADHALELDKENRLLVESSVPSGSIELICSLGLEQILEPATEN